MADDADRAGENIENTVSDGIADCRRALGSLLPVGCCHNCGELVQPRFLFCEGGECKADWELAQAARRRNGK